MNTYVVEYSGSYSGEIEVEANSKEEARKWVEDNYRYGGFITGEDTNGCDIEDVVLTKVVDDQKEALRKACKLAWEKQQKMDIGTQEGKELLRIWADLDKIWEKLYGNDDDCEY